jgi:hypothetical protein
MSTLVNLLLAVHLTVPAAPAPTMWAATDPNDNALAYDPARGWVPWAECSLERCRVPAGQAARLLQGELSLDTLSDLQITIHREVKTENGVTTWEKKASFWRFFGGQAQYTLYP